MKTLIELYDERPLENILATEVFRPERTIFLASEEIAEDEQYLEKMKSYFQFRNVDTIISFRTCDTYNEKEVLNHLRTIVNRYEDCAIDITGGTDASLFACGEFCCENDVPVFTYSRKQNLFFNIRNAPFAHRRKSMIQFTIEDFLKMAGGTIYRGRVDNAILGKYLDLFDDFFHIFMKYKRNWVYFITYMQLISQTDIGMNIPLHVEGPVKIQKKGHIYYVNIPILQELQEIGMIYSLSYNDETVSFTFRDHQCRAWLRDIGSVLELYIYKACLDTGIFNDVLTSVVVDWKGKSDVSNEIDVMASYGTTPFFISCKTGDVHTEALNELAILRDKFGGEMARAIIVSAERMQTSVKHRALELNIDVIDYETLEDSIIKDTIIAMAK